MCVEKTDWERTIEFHGHICPGISTGYRVSKIALRELSEKRAPDEELVTIVENDACGIDAVQVLTGCTIGKGNLIFKDHGKQVFTFICRKSGKAVRISVNSEAWRYGDEDYRNSSEKISSDEATKEKEELLKQHRERKIQYLSNSPEEKFCSIEHIKVDMPQKARLFNSQICAFCHEPVAESRARVREGKIACIPCAGEYTRGW